MPAIAVHKIMRYILHYYSYEITHVQDLLPADMPRKEVLDLKFLAHMEVNNEWPWYILWTDEANFLLDEIVNPQNCKIWAKKAIRNCISTGLIFFEETGPIGLVTCTVNGIRYASLCPASSY